jgi:hypothetical protein
MADDNEGVGLPSDVPGYSKKYSPNMDTPPNTKGPDKSAAEKRKDTLARQKEDQKVLEIARKRFKRSQDAESENRKAAHEDLKFLAGDQWPDDVKQQRANDKRPCLTINELPTLVHQVSNDIRQNRPDIAISPVGEVSDREGAKAYAGMIRAIQRQCEADIAYDTAVTSAVNVGFGYWRIITEYENEKSLNQVIRVQRIRNAFRVYPDPERQEPDGSDMSYCFVTDVISREEYKDKYPGADQLGWTEKAQGDEMALWVQKDFVRIAEYWTLEHEMKRLVQLSNGHIGFWEDLDPEIKKQVESGDVEILKERESEIQKVVFRRITGLQVLEKKEWPGRWIPIVEVVGEELDVSGKLVRSGIIRHAKDPQRMLNYWNTAKTEFIALAPKSPWVMAEGQKEGHEFEWDNAHQKAMAVLEYTPVEMPGGALAPPPQRQPMAGVPQGVVEAEQTAQQHILATTGVRYNATAQDRLYDESGKALHEIRRNTDVGSFHFMDNFCRSLRHTGRIFVDLIPKVYDVRRVVTILREDDTEEQVTLDPEMGKPFMSNQNAKSKVARKIFDPTIGEYGVTVTTGPSYATKRVEAVEQLMRFAQALPQQGALIAHLIAKYSDWPGADEAYRLLQKALPPNLQAPDMKDVPPQAAAMIQSLMSNVRQLTVERMQMLKDLTDQRADRALKATKIQTDYDAKLLKIFTDARTKLIQVGAADVRHVREMEVTALPDAASTGGTADGAPQFPNNPAALPVSAVQQPLSQ